ncbi:MAG: 3-hydroxybutyrate dehydrogenase, partial [Comamonadaceae bacterium CG_4_9_14_0_8_um_filter_57_21]
MLTGKTALITGSTSGIGLGIAEHFAQQGANIVLNGMGDAIEIEATRSRLEATYPVKVRFFGADMSQSAAIEAMFQSVNAE